MRTAICFNGPTKVHAFADGKNRTVFVAAFIFLRLNGVFLTPDPGLGLRMMEELASDQVGEDAFGVWLRDLPVKHDTV